MNILIFSWRGPGHPNAGGAEISTHEHARGWVKAGHSVTLFTSYFINAKREEVLDGIEIKRYGRQMFGVQCRAFIWYLFKSHKKFDLVIDQFHGIPFFTPFYVQSKKLAFIHEVAKEVWRLNQWPKPYNLFPAILGTIFEPLVFKLLYKNIPFMAVSESTKQDLISWGIPSQKITVVHNGVITPKNIHYFQKEKEPTLIFLGALSKDKGIEDALKVFFLLKQQEKDFQFWVVGKSDADYLSYLYKQAKKIGIEDHTKFWGYVTEDKKNNLLARSHLLISPSIREGWGLAVIEAAGMGTPCVGYNVAGLRDSIIDDRTGILTKKNTPEAMAEDVYSLLTDNPRYMQMCNYAKKWSSKFSWVNSVKQSSSLIKHVYEKNKEENAK